MGGKITHVSLCFLHWKVSSLPGKPNEYMKRCWTLLDIKEVQIKTVVRSYFIPIRMATIKRLGSNNSWVRGQKLELLDIPVGV